MVVMADPQGDPGATRVMPTAQPTYSGGSSPPPKSSPPTWLIALIAVLGGLLLGGVIMFFVLSPRLGPSPAASTVATSTAETTSSTAVTPPASTTAPSATAAQPPAASTPEPDTTPPKTPHVTFPADNYWLSPDDMKVEIRWDAVHDASGVRYVLEFSEWLGGGAGWTTAKRTSPVKRLYYDREVASFKERYRLIAIDGAGNESAPTAWRLLIQAPTASDAASENANYKP